MNTSLLGLNFYTCYYCSLDVTAVVTQTIVSWKFGADFFRQRIKSMFYHAYDSYLNNAFPYDELRPLTCDGQDTWGR